MRILAIVHYKERFDLKHLSLLQRTRSMKYSSSPMSSACYCLKNLPVSYLFQKRVVTLIAITDELPAFILEQQPPGQRLEPLRN